MNYTFCSFFTQAMYVDVSCCLNETMLNETMRFKGPADREHTWISPCRTIQTAFTINQWSDYPSTAHLPKTVTSHPNEPVTRVSRWLNGVATSSGVNGSGESPYA